MHLVAEERASIGVGGEVIVATDATELDLGCAQQLMTIGLERVLARPDLSDDFEPGIIAMGMDDDQPATWRQSPSQRRQYPLCLELDRSAGPVWLRGNNEIVIGDCRAAPRPHLVEQKFVVVAVKNEHDRPVVDRVATPRADARAPMFGEKRLQIGDLLFEFVRRRASQRHLVPHQSSSSGH